MLLPSYHCNTMTISKLTVQPLDVHEGLRSDYHSAIGCVGYESRSRYFFENKKIIKAFGASLVFEKQRELAFAENQEAFRRQNFEEFSIDGDSAQCERQFEKLFECIREAEGASSRSETRLIVDISSMTRQMIALTCLHSATLLPNHTVICDFIYSPAAFGELPDMDGPILSNGPVASRFAGWCSMPGAPCGLVLGIGYEEDLALGVIEDLEAGAVWAFRPINPDARYDEAIETHNRGLFDVISLNSLVRYSLDDPYALFASVEQLVALSKSDYRVIIVPLGPKVFSLASSLACLANYPEVGLWRVSAGPNLKPVERKPTGELVGLRAVFRS